MQSTKRITIRGGAAAAFFLAVMFNAVAAPAVTAAGESGLDQLIDKAVGKKACAGMAIGVERNGLHGGRFLGTAGNGRPPNADTEFRIGSITKTFTAALLAWEDQRGVMHISDPLQAYAPPGTTVPTYEGQAISLLDLADHTSGLPRTMPTKGDTTSAAAAWKYLAGYRLTYAPGTKYLYSNLAFGLLGQAIADKERMPYETLLTSVIARPLGLDDTVIELSPAQRARAARGYQPNGKPATAASSGFPALAPAGAASSTLSDMMRYLDFLLGETKSPLSTLIPVMERNRFPAANGRGVGLSWQIERLADGTQLFYKAGAVPGFSAFIIYAPSTRTGAVVLANQAKCPVQQIGSTLVNDLNQSQGPAPVIDSSDGTE
jgi:serine-type D-Ala-D-Ala carboxypeptidase/endopeptidase